MKKKQLPVVVVKQTEQRLPEIESQIENDLIEFCRKIRLMSERDIDATMPKILKMIYLKGRERPIGGSELSRTFGINRITILHHLKRLEQAGFVKRTNGKYMFRFKTISEMLLEFRKEMEQTFYEMDELTRKIDEYFAEIEQEFRKKRR